LKHISVVACISAAGEHMTPFSVSSQVNPTVERRLKSEEFRLGVDLILKHGNERYMNSQLFAEYISTVLLLYVDELQSNEEFSDKKVVLLIGNCFVHVQGDALQIWADHRVNQVKVLTFPLYITHNFQSLDLSLFGNFKKRMNDGLPLETDEITTGFIKRIFHMIKQTFVEDNVRSSFMQLGLTYEINTIPCVLIFDEHVPRQSPGFTSLCERDYPIEKVLQIRRNATCGWINKMMHPDWDSRE
jgi:hypothetical protein